MKTNSISNLSQNQEKTYNHRKLELCVQRRINKLLPYTKDYYNDLGVEVLRSKLSKKERAILDVVNSIAGDICLMSQQTIATQAHCDIKTVKRAFQVFNALKILKVIPQGYRKINKVIPNKRLTPWQNLLNLSLKHIRLTDNQKLPLHPVYFQKKNVLLSISSSLYGSKSIGNRFSRASSFLRETVSLQIEVSSACGPFLEDRASRLLRSSIETKGRTFVSHEDYPAYALGGIPLVASADRQMLEAIARGEATGEPAIDPFSPNVRKLRDMLNLTLLGCCEFSEYPENVLAYVLQRLNSAGQLLNPYAFARSIAKTALGKQEPNWRKKKDLIRAYKLDSTGPKYEDKSSTRSSERATGVTRNDLETRSSRNDFGFNSQKGEEETSGSFRQSKNCGCPDLGRPAQWGDPIPKCLRKGNERKTSTLSRDTVQPHASPQRLEATAHKFTTLFPAAYLPFLLKYYELNATGSLDAYLKNLIDTPLDSARPPQEQIDERATEYDALLKWQQLHAKDNQRYDVKLTTIEQKQDEQ